MSDSLPSQPLANTSPHLTSITHTKMEKMCLFDGVYPATLLLIVPEHLEEDKGRDARGADGLKSLGFGLKGKSSLFISPAPVMTNSHCLKDSSLTEFYCDGRAATEDQKTIRDKVTGKTSQPLLYFEQIIDECNTQVGKMRQVEELICISQTLEFDKLKVGHVGCGRVHILHPDGSCASRFIFTNNFKTRG